ncbi:MAG: carboxypeptidase-like regulatory domain-containing protein, partial [Bacteroidota bacterium]
MKFYLKCFSVIFILFFSFALTTNAQVTIRGEVRDAENNDPLIGANLIIEGTSEGNVTDFDGNFELTTDKKLPFNIVVSYTGYSSQTLEVTSADKPIIVKLS